MLEEGGFARVNYFQKSPLEAMKQNHIYSQVQSLDFPNFNLVEYVKLGWETNAQEPSVLRNELVFNLSRVCLFCPSICSKPVQVDK